MKIIIPILIIVMASCKYKKETVKLNSNYELKWLLTGLPDELIAENIVAKMYGFQFLSFGDCVVSIQLRDSIKKENQITKKLLSKKYGKNWRNDFDKRVEYVNSIIHSYRY